MDDRLARELLKHRDEVARAPYVNEWDDEEEEEDVPALVRLDDHLVHPKRPTRAAGPLAPLKLSMDMYPPAEQVELSPPLASPETSPVSSSSRAVQTCDLLRVDDPTFADVVFVIGAGLGGGGGGGGGGAGRRFYAHRFVLGARSHMFRAMLFRSFVEAESGLIEIPDEDPAHFEIMLRVMYNDTHGDALNAKNVVGVLGLASKYQVECLRSQCVSFMRARERTAADVFDMLVSAPLLFDDEEAILCHFSRGEDSARKLLQSDAFKSLPPAKLEFLLKYRQHAVGENVLFLSLLEWAFAECARKGLVESAEDARPLGRIEGTVLRQVIGDTILSCIHFPTMSLFDLSVLVRPRGLLTQAELFAIFQAVATNNYATLIDTPAAIFPTHSRS